MAKKMKVDIGNMRSEKEVRAWFKAWFEASSKSKHAAGLTWIEFALGGSPGAPDVLLPTNKMLVAVELKLGSLRGSDGAMVADFRPAQINWHTDMARSGIQTFAIVATSKGCFCFPGKHVHKFMNGAFLEWPQFSFACLGDIHEFFGMMADEKKRAESIANYQKSLVRIEREMAPAKTNWNKNETGGGQIVDKPRSKNARVQANATTVKTGDKKAKPKTDIKICEPTNQARKNLKAPQRTPKPHVVVAANKTGKSKPIARKARA